MTDNKQTLKFSRDLSKKGMLEHPTIKNIAEKMNISTKQATSRINELYTSGFGKITVALDYNKLPIIMAEIGIKSSNPIHNNYIFDFLKNVKYVEEIVQLSSHQMTFMINVKVPSLEQLSDVTIEIANGLGDKYSKLTTMIIANKIYDDEIFFEKKGEVEKLDKTDWQILSMLKRNAMMPLREIAKKTKLREPTVHRRIRILKEKKIILGYMSIRNWANIPLELCTLRSLVFIRRPNADVSEKSFIESLSKSNNSKIAFAVSYFGSWDFIIGVKSENVVALDRFLDNDVAKNENVIDMKVYTILQSHRRDVFADFAK